MLNDRLIPLLNIKVYVCVMYIVLLTENPFLLLPLKYTTDKYLLNIALKRCPTVILRTAPSPALPVRQRDVKDKGFGIRKAGFEHNLQHFHFCEL